MLLLSRRRTLEDIPPDRLFSFDSTSNGSAAITADIRHICGIICHHHFATHTHHQHFLNSEAAHNSGGERFLHAHRETGSGKMLLSGLFTVHHSIHHIDLFLDLYYYASDFNLLILLGMFGRRPLKISVTASKKSMSNTATSTPEQGPSTSNVVPLSTDYLPEAYITGTKVISSALLSVCELSL